MTQRHTLWRAMKCRGGASGEVRIGEVAMWAGVTPAPLPPNRLVARAAQIQQWIPRLRRGVTSPASAVAVVVVVEALLAVAALSRGVVAEAQMWVCLVRWALRPRLDVNSFTYGKNLRLLMRTVVALLVVEGIVVEAVLVLSLSHASPWVWIVLALHVYGLVWIGGFLGSLRVLPHEFHDGSLVLRDSVFTAVVIPFEQIKSVRPRRRGYAGRSGFHDRGRGRPPHLRRRQCAARPPLQRGRPRRIRAIAAGPEHPGPQCRRSRPLRRDDRRADPATRTSSLSSQQHPEPGKPGPTSRVSWVGRGCWPADLAAERGLSAAAAASSARCSSRSSPVLGESCSTRGRRTRVTGDPVIRPSSTRSTAPA